MFLEKLLDSVKEPIAGCILEEQFQRLKRAGKFAVWGTGLAAEYAIEQCKTRNLTPVCICDSFPHEANALFKDMPLLSEDVFFRYFEHCYVLICCLETYGIKEKLEKKGCPYEVWDTTLLHIFADKMSFSQQLWNNRQIINKLYYSFADDESRHIYENVIKYRLTGNRALINEIYDPKIYFDNDVITNVNCDAFVDCGAYTGDTLEAFHKSGQCKCNTYYALEPYSENIKIIKKVIRDLDIRYVEIICAGAWNQKDILRFSNVFDGGTGKVSGEGGVCIPVETIDDITKSNKVGFIKMDIEGSEKFALRGAIKTIKVDKPTAAVSIYHVGSDLWEIPIYLREINPGYKLYIRHHSNVNSDTVCYAIPNK